ncbi:hypothetical protein Goshw_019687 [Gossypium schwendimanii]|uniref:Uncharacterized protein n=1 Tax=Gossypium schwendimanii TaxID=34291 RepID=A0A7J9N8X5_GOSSC|nr:hypothetical protein [Gossypium schwendimanii]
MWEVCTHKRNLLIIGAEVDRGKRGGQSALNQVASGGDSAINGQWMVVERKIRRNSGVNGNRKVDLRGEKGSGSKFGTPSNPQTSDGLGVRFGNKTAVSHLVLASFSLVLTGLSLVFAGFSLFLLCSWLWSLGSSGKFTLITTLSDSNLYSDARLFATLDCWLKNVVLPSG